MDGVGEVFLKIVVCKNLRFLKLTINKIKLFLKRVSPFFSKGGWAVGEALTVPLLMLMLSPWLLRTLGKIGFGQWMLALSLNGFVHMTSLGAGVAVMLGVAQINSKNSHEEIGRIIKAGLLVAICSGGILIFTVWFVSSHVVSLFFSKMGLPSVVENVLVLGVILLALQQVDEILAGALRGMQRFDLVAKVEIYGRPVWAVLIAFVAYHTADVICLLQTHLFYTVVRTVCRIIVVTSLLGKNFFHDKFSLSYVKKLVKTGKWISVQSVGGVMFSTLDRLCVGGLFGAEGMSRYAICTQISQFVHNLQAAALQVIIPWVTKSKKRNLLKMAVLTGFACLVFPFAVMSGSWWLLDVWMGTGFADENEKLMLLLLIGTAILAFTIPAHYVVLGVGKTKICATILLVGGALSLMASVGLAAWGLIAFSIGRLVYGAVALGYFFVIKNFNSK